MKKDLTVKSVLVNGAIALSLIGAISTPAHAVTIPVQENNPLSQLFGQLNQQLTSLQGYFQSVVTEKLQPLSESLEQDIDAVVSDAAGALGLPDPTQTRDEVERMAIASDSLVYSAERATNEVERQITRGAVDSTLGKAGQQTIQQEADKTQSFVASVQQQAQTAQGEVVTQNVMKQMALQNAQISSMLGSIRADSLQAAQRQELTNLNLTNISRTLDGQNQARQAEAVGAGLDTLRISSRARLF